MSIFQFLPPEYYNSFHYIAIFLMGLATVLFYMHAKQFSLFKNKAGVAFAILFGVSMSFFWGMRPHDSRLFGDTWLYAYSYENLSDVFVPFSFSSEWLWDDINYVLHSQGVSTSLFFVIIELLYVGLNLAACWNLTRNNVWLSFLFCVSSFSFLSYGVNGIRNGLACSLVLFSISLFNNEEIKYGNVLASAMLLLAAIGVHSSVWFPIIGLLLSVTVVHDSRYAIAIWCGAIMFSLAMGDYMTNIIPEFEMADSRLSDYLIAGENEYEQVKFSHTGFRWDFVLYSAIPIIMVYYVTIKRNFRDVTYNIISNTYILANSLWIIVIRASYSNRFAYLSWFIYPLVIAYPLVRMNLWDNQEKKAALILLAYTGFTIFMNFVYYV